MSRVLVCIPCLMTGGTEIQTLSLVKALRNTGHSVLVACYFEHSPEMVKNYRDAGASVCLFSPSGSRPAGILKTASLLLVGFRKAIRDFKPDIAHVQYMAPGAIPIILLRTLGIRKIIATAHTSADIYSPRGLKLLHWLNRNLISAFQCISLRAEKSFFGDAALLSHNTQFNTHGNHFTVYNNLPDYIPIRTAPRSHTPGGCTVGVISRLEKIKGMDLVVPAFARLTELLPNQRQNLKLLVVGDGSLRTEMEQEARNLGISELVEFAGRQPQNLLADFYNRIDILLMPSRSEGFGLTAVEGMACGCVPLVADTGGLPEVVRNGVDGILHNPGSANDIADNLCHLIQTSGLIENLSQAALTRAHDFSANLYNSRIKLLYENIGGA